MAVVVNSNTESVVHAEVVKKNKRKMAGGGGVVDDPKSSDNVASQQRKRNKSPGVRVVGGRIYDSENGKTCHQCRQKTLDFSTDCKNNANGKPCTLKYCYTCLMNRYGEKAEDMASLKDWSCPRCRDICNCSICMKKRGHKPTGMLVQMAKAGGFSSVSDLLHVKGAENVDQYMETMKQISASPRKQYALEEGSIISSPKKMGKENICDGKTDLNVIPPSVKPAMEHKRKEKKRKGSKVVPNVEWVNDASPDETLNDKNQKDPRSEGLTQTHDAMLSQETSHHSIKKQVKKTKIQRSKKMPEAEVDADGGANKKHTSLTKSQDINGYFKHGMVDNETVDGVQEEGKTCVVGVCKDETEKMNNGNKSTEVSNNTSHENTNLCVKAIKIHKVKNKTFNLHDKYHEVVIPLPMGSELVTIGGVDLPKEDTGHALQFLEFCAVFGKILNIKEGWAEVVLRELIKGRSVRRGKCSLITQFHIQLLSIIHEDTGSNSPMFDPTLGKETWLKALKSCIPKSKQLQEAFDFLDKKDAGYDHLSMSLKLRLLNFLCDEVLGTGKIRDWIDDQNIKFAEQKKEAKQSYVAAKDKEKCLKQQMHNDIANALIARNGIPLTINDHEAVVSEIKKKTAQAHAEMLECKRMVPIDKERPDAVRTAPVLRDNKGHVYWRLKGFSDKSAILCQEIQMGDDTPESGESWFRFDAEQTTLIDNHINAMREGRCRPGI